MAGSAPQWKQKGRFVGYLSIYAVRQSGVDPKRTFSGAGPRVQIGLRVVTDDR